MPPQGTSSRAAPRVASHRGPGVLYIPCFLGPVQGKIRLTCHPNGGLLLVFRVTRAFAASRDPPPPLPVGRIEPENSPSFKLERYAGIAVSEGIRGRSRKDIHFQARHAAGRLRLPCRAHGAASSLARRRHPQHALRADWITQCHPQLASSGTIRRNSLSRSSASPSCSAHGTVSAGTRVNQEFLYLGV
jgi:hypothetical protein